MSLELEMDSISLFSFLDSLAFTQVKSEMGIRFGYTSSWLAAGRDFNVQQHGYSPGLSYFHKSGLYADLTSYFSDESVNQSIAHLGYVWAPGKRWTINPYFEKLINHDSGPHNLKQSIGGSIIYDFKLAEIGSDYVFLWGNETGHRLIPSLSKQIEFNNIPLVKKLSFYPNFSLIIGTTTIFSYRYSNDQVNDYLLYVQHISDEEIILLVRSGKITTEQAIRLRIARRLLNDDTIDDKEALLDWLNTLDEKNAFGLLSYNFSLPVSFKVGRFTTVMLSYSYAVPVKFPGEDLDISPSSYFSFSISRRIIW